MARDGTAMDPALLELIAAGSPGDEVAVIVRTRPGCPAPPALRVVARFGDIATGRAQRGLLIAIHADPGVESLKAPRVYAGEANPFADRPPPSEPGPSEADPAMLDSDRRRPPGLAETGRGTVVVVVDWGFDFAHPDFRRDDGGTRLLALWDQRAPGTCPRYGYGRIHSRATIDRALAMPDAFAALGYRPSETRAPCHGTHVMGIAAGNGRAGGPQGVAPDAELIFVHLGPGLGDLGNSIDLLEAIDFAVRAAGERGLAINLSIGRHAGPHDGSLLVEQAIDWLIVNRPGTVVVQSTGNYYTRNVHAEGRLHEARSIALSVALPVSDPHAATVELWYKGADRFLVRAFAPDGSAAIAEVGQQASLVDASGVELARLYHRSKDPNNGDNLIALILRPFAPAGKWRIEITGLDVIDGRWHAWIERNAANPRAQAQFSARDASPLNTTGSICHAMRTIAVGAYDGHDPAHPLALFSSVGPTRDGRRKPLLAARGVRELSVRSRLSVAEPPDYVRMSGTSMAAPQVTGTAALMLEAAGRQPIAAIRQALFATLDPPGPAPPGEEDRWGYGTLNIEAAVAAARRLGVTHPSRVQATPQEAFVMAGNDFESATPPMSGPPVQDEERRWSKGRRSTLKTPEERVLSQFSEAELRDMLGLPPQPPIVVASAEADSDPAPAPPAAPPEPDPFFDDPAPPEPSVGAADPGMAYPGAPPAANAPPAGNAPPAANAPLAPPTDPKALLNVAVNPQVSSTQVVGWPGARLAVPLIAGDIILRDHRRPRRTRMVRSPGVLARTRLAPRAGKPREAGFYAEVFGGEGEERIAGPDGLLLPDVTIIRSLAAYGGESLPSVARPTVRIGSRGPAVSEAQARLNAISARWLPETGVGLDRCPLTQDGAFGPNTRAAVISFQRRVFPDQPQEWDGIVGQRTWAALIAASGPARKAEPAIRDFAGPPVDDEAVTAADIAANLAAIKLTSVSVNLGMQPNSVDFNTIARANPASKKYAFNPFMSAVRSATKARKDLAKLRATVPAGQTPSPKQQRAIAAAAAEVASQAALVERTVAAVQAWLKANGSKYNSALAAIGEAIRKAETTLAKARAQRNQAAITQAEQGLARLVAERTSARAEVDRLIAAYVPLVPLTGNLHRLEIDGRKIELHDHVVSFATVDWRGLEGNGDGDGVRSGGRARVQQQLAQFATGDRRKILEIISAHEGTFSNVNTWDRAIVTFGFVQWTFGEGGGGSLVELLSEIKRREPGIFEARLQRYGIDVVNRKVQLTQANGTVLSGADAAQAMRFDVKLIGVLSRLGLESKVQEIQVHQAIASKIDFVRNQRIEGFPINYSDIFSSGYAVAVLTDRVIAAGRGGANKSLVPALKTFMKDNPGADLTQQQWQALAEPIAVAALVATDPKRLASYAGFSKARGSFSP